MEKEFTFLKMEVNIKVILIKEILILKVYYFKKTVTCTTENFSKIKLTVLEFFITLMVLLTKENEKIIYKKVKAT